MKTLKTVFGVLTIGLAVAALALFFVLPFGRINLTDGTFVEGVASEFAFGSIAGKTVGKSADILFCGILTLLSAVFAGLSMKFKGTRWATIGFSGVGAVYMLVIGLRHSNFYLDTQGLIAFDKVNNGSTAYLNSAPLLIAAALLLTIAAGVAYLLIADKIAVKESGDAKLPIPKRVVKFLKDYKGEIKKIVWPNFRTVVKNTIIVLVMCAIVGVFIWAVDIGLNALLRLIYK